MRRLIFLLSFWLLVVPAVSSQTSGESLRQGKPIERSLFAGQPQSYTLSLEKDQFAQITVDQRGIDVVVRVYLPDGKLLREVDSPTGSEGAENVEIISEVAGIYRLEIAPLNDDVTVSGKYQIEIVEIRNANEAELRQQKNEDTRKTKGRALVVEASQSFDQFRLPETRVTMRLTAAQLLWPSDEKKASALIAQAIEIIRQLIADNANQQEGDNVDYQTVINLRELVINALAPHDPEAALKFLQSTHQAGNAAGRSDEQELQLESSLINLIVANDPKRAFELAEDMLRRSSSPLLIQTLTQLAVKNPELASRLARDVAKKIEGEEFTKSLQSAYLSTSLLQVVRNTPQLAKQDGGGTEKGGLLTDEEYRELFLKIVAEVMAYEKSEDEFNGPEFAMIQNLASTIVQLDEVKTYAGDRAAAINKKLADLGMSSNPRAMDWQRYQTVVSTEPVESALQSVEQAPAPMRNYLYQQLVNRIAASGDVSRARQIVSEKVDESQRQQLLYTLQERDVTVAAERGKFDQALRLLSKFPPASRYALLNQIVERIGPSAKRAQAVQYLEQAKNLTTNSVRAEDSDQMQTLLTIARAFARHDLNRSFQIVEPLIDQFNEISAAAVTMNGFGQQYYVEGELSIGRENPVANIGDEIADTLSSLAMFDFDRAKRDADGINRLDARVRTFLKIAERTLELRIKTEESEVRVDY